MHDYPVLKTISGLARIIGWIGVAIAACLLAYGIFKILNATTDLQPTGEAGPFGTVVTGPNLLTTYTGILNIVSAFLIAYPSFIIIMLGEAVMVFIDMEENTRRTADLISQHFGTAQPSETTPLRNQ